MRAEAVCAWAGPRPLGDFALIGSGDKREPNILKRPNMIIAASVIYIILLCNISGQNYPCLKRRGFIEVHLPYQSAGVMSRGLSGQLTN
jgi:hypothetical protein